jgi:hypothetical protein
MAISKDQILDICAEANVILNDRIHKANDEGNLWKLLNRYDMQELYPLDNDNEFPTNPRGKILIIGHTKVKQKDIIGCTKDLGIEKNRLEIVTDYEGIKKYKFNHIQYNPNYRLILFGPSPHSGVSKENDSSIITTIENKDGYPKIKRLTDGHALKISTTSLKEALIEEIADGYLEIFA